MFQILFTFLAILICLGIQSYLHQRKLSIVSFEELKKFLDEVQKIVESPSRRSLIQHIPRAKFHYLRLTIYGVDDPYTERAWRSIIALYNKLNEIDLYLNAVPDGFVPKVGEDLKPYLQDAWNDVCSIERSKNER